MCAGIPNSPGIYPQSHDREEDFDRWLYERSHRYEMEMRRQAAFFLLCLIAFMLAVWGMVYVFTLPLEGKKTAPAYKEHGMDKLNPALPQNWIDPISPIHWPDIMERDK